MSVMGGGWGELLPGRGNVRGKRGQGLYRSGGHNERVS